MKIGGLIVSIFLITNFCSGQKKELKDDLCKINQNVSRRITDSFSILEMSLVDAIDNHIEDTYTIFISKKQIVKLRGIQDQMRKVDFMMHQYGQIRTHCDTNIIEGLQKEIFNDSSTSIPGKRQLRLLRAEYQLQEELFWYEKGNCEYRLYTLKIELINELLKLRSMVIHHKYFRKKSLRNNTGK
jgi:hypothetical protein